MQPLRPQPGSSIDPKDAVGRARTTERALRELAHGNNLALTDPRRMGKTVWIDLFCDRPDGIVAVKIDYEGVISSSEFLLRTVHGLRPHLGTLRRATKAIGAFFDGFEGSVGPVSVKRGVSTKTPTDLLTEAIRAVDVNLEDQRLVIAMDEVPIAIANITKAEGPDQAHHVLQVLRNLRDSRAINWIVCGSIGFHHVLRGCGATEGAINDLVNLPLGPLDEDDARLLAHRLLLGIGREPRPPHLDDVLHAMERESGSIPFLIHKLAHLLHQGRGPTTPAHVGEAFTAFVEDRDESRAVTHLLTRLEPLYGARAPSAHAVLDAIAVDGPMTASDLDAVARPRTDIREILDDLIDDHYLLTSAGSLRWRYDVLRRIWVHRKGLT